MVDIRSFGENLGQLISKDLSTSTKRTTSSKAFRLAIDDSPSYLKRGDRTLMSGRQLRESKQTDRI